MHSMSQATIADRFAAAFNTRDVEQVVKLFTADVTYNNLFYGVHRGHAGLRELFERMYREGSHHEWTMTTVVATPEVTIGEWRFEFTVADTVPKGAGRTLRFNGTSIFAARGSRCYLYREFFDRAAALLAVGVAPASLARIVANRPTIEVAEPAGEIARS